MKRGFTYPRARNLFLRWISEPAINMMVISLDIGVSVPEHINVVKGNGKFHAFRMEQFMPGSLMHPDNLVLLDHPVISPVFFCQGLSPGISIRFPFG